MQTLTPGRDLAGPRGQAARRICAGNCEHFEALYEWGRKIAGTGVCEKNEVHAPVRVGMPCLWSTSLSLRGPAAQPAASAVTARP